MDFFNLFFLGFGIAACAEADAANYEREEAEYRLADLEDELLDTQYRLAQYEEECMGFYDDYDKDDDSY